MSGGADELALVYEIGTIEPKLTLKGHLDTI